MCKTFIKICTMTREYERIIEYVERENAHGLEELILKQFCFFSLINWGMWCNVIQKFQKKFSWTWKADSEICMEY